MARVITVTNQKGGAGKTTTAMAIAEGLTKTQFGNPKVLAIDMDAQCNFTYTVKANEQAPTILGVLTKEIQIGAAIQHLKHIDFIPGNKGLAGADSFIMETGREYRLRDALESVLDKYEYIIIDTPPALGILTINALTASDYVVIPAQADLYSMQGIEQLVNTINPVKQYCNPKLEIMGIVLTRYSPRSVLSRDVATLIGKLAESIGTKVFKTTIREAVVVKEAQISRTSLYAYAPKQKVTADYKELTNEIYTADCKARIDKILSRGGKVE